MKNISQFFNVKLNIDKRLIVVFVMTILINGITKGQTSTTNTLSSVNVVGSARVDSVLIGKDTIIAQKDIRVEGDIKVKGDAKVKGNLKIDGKIKFDNATGISYLSPAASSTAQGQYFFGKQSNTQGPLTFPMFIPCNSSTLTEGADPKFNFSGMINSFSQGPNISASMHMGMASWGSGMIEVGGVYNGLGSPGLLINYFCGRNIAMCTGANGGNVYIGNFLNASKHVEISDPLLPNNDPNNVSLEISTVNGKGIKFNTYNNALPLISISNINFNSSPFTVFGDGRTYIGVQKPLVTGPHVNAKLAVDGKILAKEIFVNIHNTVWADYVFDKNYKLMPLNEVEFYISENKHLPNVPSANDLTANDEYNLSLSDMHKIQMEKIEELYLHAIKQQKEIEALKLKIKELEGK